MFEFITQLLKISQRILLLNIILIFPLFFGWYIQIIYLILPPILFFWIHLPILFEKTKPLLFILWVFWSTVSLNIKRILAWMRTNQQTLFRQLSNLIICTHGIKFSNFIIVLFWFECRFFVFNYFLWTFNTILS